METFLSDIPFREPGRARRALVDLMPEVPEPSRDALQLFLSGAPEPDSVVTYLNRYRTASGGDFQRLFTSPTRLNAALAVFSHSQFLSEAMIRRPELLDWALQEEQLYRLLETDEMRSDLGAFPPDRDDATAAEDMARFKRMHLLRIVLRDILGLATLAEVTLELSNLADSLLSGAHDFLYQHLVQRFGRPLTPSVDGPLDSQFVVLALGKLGGAELNYSSDIDLMFLYTGEGTTAGPIDISNKDFYSQLANRLTGLLSQMTPEGSCYRVDLRLRPEGRSGELVLPLGVALDYYHRRARDWELQMLIKARPCGGSRELGLAFLRMIEPLIYRTTTDFSTVEKVAETRDRIQSNLRSRKSKQLNIKLTRGGIRDIEFLVQCLQRLYGGSDPWVRHGGTLLGLHRLRDKGYLAAPDYARLSTAYQYFRGIEHRLQMEQDRQVHSLPDRREAREILARKIHGDGVSEGSAEILHRKLQSYLKMVQEIYERVVYTQAPGPAARSAGQREKATGGRVKVEGELDPSWQSQLRHLERAAPELTTAIQGLTIRHGQRLFEHFINKVIPIPELLSELRVEPQLLLAAADLAEHSPYLTEQLIRDPSSLRALRTCVEANSGDSHGESIGRTPSQAVPPLSLFPEVQQMLEKSSDAEEKAGWLRRFFRRKMFRLLAESICCSRPIFDTLHNSSRLAECVIAAAHHLAVEEACRSQGRESPPTPLEVIALGRLGMREFDLGSDADLVFVVPDESAESRRWYRDVIERMIEIISSYTKDGTMFSVDMRLRPLGRDGEIVQSEQQYRAYFAEQAEPWEALTYMKARAIAGDVGKATVLLHRLQDVDWKRYGLREDLAGKLRSMRERLEIEQGPKQPIKAGRGGYYDIDFMLMFLRLRDAGIFFPSLNTPERIDAVTVTGGLTPEEGADLLQRAVFYRSLDHAIRVTSGHSSSRIPTSRAKQEVLSDLICRWSPLKPPADDLPGFVAEVCKQTRARFDTVFRSRPPRLADG